MVTVQQLKAFCAAVETGSISMAAERLCLSQPAVSKIISSLEQDTRLNLFDREHRRIVPTSEAHFLYKEARRLLAEFNNITLVAEELRALHAGSLSVASIMALGLHIIPSSVGKILRSRPNTDVTFRARSSSKIMQWAIAQQIDFGIVSTTMEHEAVSKEALGTIHAVCIMPRNHRLAARTHINAKDLDGEPFIAFVKDGSMREVIDKVFEDLNVRPRCMANASNSHVACTLAKHLNAVSLVDPYTAMHILRQEELVMKPFSPSVNYSYQLIWPRYRASNPLANILVTEIKTTLDQYDRQLEEQLGTSLLR